MSRRIAKLLDEPAHTVTRLINNLENKNGYPSHDARLLAENVQKIRQKTLDLGLDPDDTTAEELYHALLIKFKEHSARFDKYFKAENLDFDQRVKKAIDLIKKNEKLPQTWALKTKAAKAVIAQHPPKHLMKYLNYRSAESMLKRENINEIFLGSQLLESTAWHKVHNRLISQLSQLDFELGPIKLQWLSYEKWNDIADSSNYVASDDNRQVIGILPSKELKIASFLTVTLLLLEELSSNGQIKLTNSLIKMGGMVMWWMDMDHLIAELDSEPVSLNLKDNATNFLSENSYNQRQLSHGRQSFWKELLSRYDNLPDIEGPFDNIIKMKLPTKLSVPEPAYDFSEEFDG